MKKAVLPAAGLFLLALLAALPWKTQIAPPLSLPDLRQVTSVTLETPAGTTVTHTEPEWIAQLWPLLTGAVPTARPTVQDCPQTAARSKIDITHEGRVTTIFCYTEDGTLLLEQPYQGIYEADTALEALIME